MNQNFLCKYNINDYNDRFDYDIMEIIKSYWIDNTNIIDKIYSIVDDILNNHLKKILLIIHHINIL